MLFERAVASKRCIDMRVFLEKRQVNESAFWAGDQRVFGKRCEVWWLESKEGSASSSATACRHHTACITTVLKRATCLRPRMSSPRWRQGS